MDANGRTVQDFGMDANGRTVQEQAVEQAVDHIAETTINLSHLLLQVVLPPLSLSCYNAPLLNAPVHRVVRGRALYVCFQA